MATLQQHPLRSRSRQSPWHHWLGTWREFDGILFASVLALAGMGVLAIHSTDHSNVYWTQQLIMAGICVLPCLMLSRLNYERLLQWHWLIYGLTLVSLIAVLVGGTSGGGAERWLMISGIQIQPSEFAKLGVILTLAAILHHWPIKYFSQVWVAVAVIAVPWILIFLQPNLGTSVVFVVILLAMLYWAGAHGSWIILLVSPVMGAMLYGLVLMPDQGWLVWVWLGWCGGMAALAAWQLPWWRVGALTFGALNLLSGQLGQLGWRLLKPYQQTRLLIFTDPSQDPLGAGYHLIQSRIAIGAGGLWGKGLFRGTQTQLDFIPEQHTDFVFSVVGEELGFVGTATVLILLWILCLRLLMIAHSAKDNFGSLVAIGVFAMILFQAVVNIGMTMGLAPITGLPLPFLSYGRSALLTNFIAIGLVESISLHRQRTTFFS